MWCNVMWCNGVYMLACTHACMYACTCARVYVCSCLLSFLSLLLLLLLLSSSWWLLLLLFLFLFLSRLLCGPAGASSLRPLGQSDEFLRSVTKQRKIDQLESQKSALEGQLARETHGDCVRDCRSKLTCSLASAISFSFLSLSTGTDLFHVLSWCTLLCGNVGVPFSHRNLQASRAECDWRT